VIYFLRLIKVRGRKAVLEETFEINTGEYGMIMKIKKV